MKRRNKLLLVITCYTILYWLAELGYILKMAEEPPFLMVKLFMNPIWTFGGLIIGGFILLMIIACVRPFILLGKWVLKKEGS